MRKSLEILSSKYNFNLVTSGWIIILKMNLGLRILFELYSARIMLSFLGVSTYYMLLNDGRFTRTPFLLKKAFSRWLFYHYAPVCSRAQESKAL